MLLLIGALLMPPQIPADLRTHRFVSPQLITTHTPALRVLASTVGNSLSLHIALLSMVGTSADPGTNTFHAFIRVDYERTILLNLPPGGYVSLTYPGMSRGKHHVRWGVFSGSNLWNTGELCPRI